MICDTIIDLHYYQRKWIEGKVRNYEPFVNAFLIIGADLVKVFTATDYGENGRVEIYKNDELIGVIEEENFPICTIINAISKNGNGYNWISDGDGSLQKLRDSITW